MSSNDDNEGRFIPMEIITNILLRLPVKALGRCKCVSYKWYVLINTQNFIKLHLQRANSLDEDTPNFNLVYFVSSIFIHTFDIGSMVKSFCDQHTKQMPELDYRNPRIVKGKRPTQQMPGHIVKGKRPTQQMPGHIVKGKRPTSVSILYAEHYKKTLPTVSGCDVPIGSCNGIVCFRNKQGCRFLFLNPTTGSHLDLPFLVDNSGVYGSSKSLHVVWFGFGYDSIGDDYKVVKITQINKNQGCNEIMVYSWRNKKWKSCKVNKCFSLANRKTHYPRCNGTLFDNALHWFIYKMDGGITIASFDLRREKFRQSIPLPESETSPSEFRTMASVAHGNGGLHLMTTESRESVNLWIMKHYKGSWRKLDDDVEAQYGNRRTVYLSKNCSQTLLWGMNESLVNKSSLKFSDLAAAGYKGSIDLPRPYPFEDDMGASCSHSYVESLVDLNIDDRLHISKRKRCDETSNMSTVECDGDGIMLLQEIKRLRTECNRLQDGMQRLEDLVTTSLSSS